MYTATCAALEIPIVSPSSFKQHAVAYTVMPQQPNKGYKEIVVFIFGRSQLSILNVAKYS